MTTIRQFKKITFDSRIVTYVHPEWERNAGVWAKIPGKQCLYALAA